MVEKRRAPGTEMPGQVNGEITDEHIAVVGPRRSGKSFLAEALASKLHDGGRGNTVVISRYFGRDKVHWSGSPEQHTIVIHDGYIPHANVPDLRVISTSAL